MAQTSLDGTPVTLSGELPSVGAAAPPFTLTGTDLREVTSAGLAGKRVVLNISPSIDTGVCAQSVRTFNERAAGLDDVVVLYVSADLPFAQKRFCGAEGIENVVPVSTFRHPEFLTDYGVLMTDGRLQGLAARAVVVIDADGKVLHCELVPEIPQEPDYDAAIGALG